MGVLTRCSSGYGPRLRFLVIILVLLGGVLPMRDAQARAALERGAAIIDPLALRELDRGRLRPRPRHAAGALGRCAAQRTASCSRCRRWLRVRKALDAEFDRYIRRHKADLPNETIGVGTRFDFQLFDRALLDSPDARFVLAGIVNRMDRAFVRRSALRRNPADLSPDPNRCAAGRRDAASPRLPMTLNVVLKAKAVERSMAAKRHLRRDRAALARRRRSGR